MAEIHVTYSIDTLTVTVKAGELFIRTNGLRRKFILIAVSKTKAALVSRDYGVVSVGPFNVTWSVEEKPHGTSLYTMDLHNLLEAVSPGTSYRQFLEQYSFEGSADLKNILDKTD